MNGGMDGCDSWTYDPTLSDLRPFYAILSDRNSEQSWHRIEISHVTSGRNRITLLSHTTLEM